MTRPQRFTQVDTFTDRPFAGNPAAVCLLEAARDERWIVRVRVNGDRVDLGGHAVTVLRGELLH